MPGGSAFGGSRFPWHTRRVSAAPQMGGNPFLGSRYVVHTSRVSDTPLPGGGVSRSAERGRTALPRGA